MKTTTKTYYQCEICGQEYTTAKDAASCEQLPLSQDKGARVGDTVLVLNGEGAGTKGEVRKTYVIKRGWGPRKYDHTVAIIADLPAPFYGSRNLMFTDYRLVS